MLTMTVTLIMMMMAWDPKSPPQNSYHPKGGPMVVAVAIVVVEVVE